MGSISSLGIGSGFLDNELLDQVVQAQRQPVEERLGLEQQETEAKLSAFGQFKSAVSGLEEPADALKDPTAMRSFSGESSDEAVGVSVDDETVEPGSFSVEVNQLAQAQALSTQTYADRDSTAVGTGDLTFEVGDKKETITLDDSNNTLNGLKSEINDADIGVNASILNTGDGYQMVLNAEDTGEENAINITADGDADLDAFNFNENDKNLTENRAAQDAKANISGVDITRSSNTIDDVIDGVTLDLNSTTDSAADVNISQDLDGPTEKVQALVDGFNKLQGTANELTEYDPDEEEGSILSGDSTIRNTMNQLKREFGQIVPGLEDASVRALSDVGISTDFNTGQLEFDSAKFKEKLQESPDDVTALFANQGRASDGQVEFERSTDSTKPGEYDVNVDSLATRGSLAGDTAIADNVTIDADNKAFSLKVNDGSEADITLAEGDYTRTELLDEVRAQVADNPTIQAGDGDLEVNLTADDKLEFTSSTYGSNSTVEVTNASQAVTDTLGLSEGTGQAGTDVEGTIDGQTAEGDGQVLFLGRDQGDASGIQVRVRGGETGARGSVSYIEGVGNSITDRLDQLQGSDGALTSREQSFQTDLENIEEDRQDLNERINSLRERLSKQFAAADERVGQFQETGKYLQQQLGGLG